MEPSGRLAELVCQLDARGHAPSLVDLVRTMEATPLTLADVAAYVRTDEQSYHRATVVVRESYELLVMTWRPGQGSAPHDHSGSICAMRVVEGDAVESCYRIGEGGYVDLEYESLVRTGQLTAEQDAGVHALRNPSKTRRLVTVHVYAPPLRDFRRFVARPQRPGAKLLSSADERPTVVIVGGGFSGSATAAQLLRRAGSAGLALKVVLIERRGAIGEGLAYGTREPWHLLNVPAGRMSIYPEQPEHFVEWASRRYRPVEPREYLPRQWFGEYVREALLAAKEAAGGVELSVVLDEARRISRHPQGGWMVHLARGDSLRAAAVVLAVGHRPPSDPLCGRWIGPRTRFVADPWRPFALSAVRPDEPVAMFGSGLTAVDAVLSLSEAGRSAPITMISRRGLAPLAHADEAVKPIDLEHFVTKMLSNPAGVRAIEVSRKLRQAARDIMAQGGDWRGVIDGIRPHTAKLWQAMTAAERTRFMHRLRPFWEIHRHRMAPSVARRFRSLVDCGKVRLVAGKVVSAAAEADLVRLFLVERGRLEQVELACQWVANCTGPMASNSAESNPAIGSLLVDGCLLPDELSLGIETTPDGNALDAKGQNVADLFVVGTLRKPALWESTAVPELRNQAASIATQIVKITGSTKSQVACRTLPPIRQLVHDAALLRPSVS